MGTIVCKFGGSSVADAGMFARVRRIIHSCAGRKYIILSAPGKREPHDEKITDLFIRAHACSRCGDYSILAQIFERYASIRRSLAPGFGLELEFARIRGLLHTSLDYAASRGEYLCARLFSAYSGLPFVDVAGLLFFWEDGTINFERSRRAVQEKLLCHERAVIPGFYGTAADGSIRTFARGGSDVSGALIAAMTGAELYENWTDVDGLFTADPGIVASPRRSRRVSMAQMENICRAGATLLHPDSLAPLKGQGIDVLLKNTFHPDAEGTRITEADAAPVPCVTGRRRIGSDGHSAVDVFGLDKDQLQLAVRAVQPVHIIHMQDHIELIIHDDEYETTIRKLHSLLVD